MESESCAQIDSDFGSSGFSFVSDGDAWPSHAGTAIAVQQDGKILAGGFSADLTWPSGHVEGVIARLNPDGSLDPAFGNAGIFTTSLDDVYGLNFGERTSIRDIAVDLQGRILWAGGSFAGRVLADGTHDTSFGNQDPVHPEFHGFLLASPFIRFNKLIVQPDGKILVAGTQYPNGIVVRLDQNGTPDPGFGTAMVPLNYDAPPGGYSIIDFYPVGHVEEQLDAALDADGSIVVAGLMRDPGSQTVATVTKLAHDGTLCLSFGTNGQLLIDLPAPAYDERATSIAINGAGKYVIAVDTAGAEPNDFVVQLNSDGSFDTTFGEGDGIAELFTDSSDGNVRKLAIQPNGQILVTGSAGGFASSWRLNADGTPDSSFTNNAHGYVSHPFQMAHVEGANDVAIQQNGKAVVIGNQFNIPNPELPALFGIVQLIIGSPPVAIAGNDIVSECTGELTMVALDGSASWDPDGDPLEFEWSVPEGSGAVLNDPFSTHPVGIFPMGPTLVTLTVSDGNGGIAVDDVLVTVQDTTPPVLVCTTDKIALWPPNHQMQEVWICIAASEACTSPEHLQIDCTISSNEPDNSSADGDTAGDVDGVDGYSSPVPVSDFVYDGENACFYAQVSLRAERMGSSSGRVYSIVCNVTDSSNNSATASCVVVVPKNGRR